eukprot:gene1500-biopygen18330
MHPVPGVTSLSMQPSIRHPHEAFRALLIFALRSAVRGGTRDQQVIWHGISAVPSMTLGVPPTCITCSLIFRMNIPSFRPALAAGEDCCTAAMSAPSITIPTESAADLSSMCCVVIPPPGVACKPSAHCCRAAWFGSVTSLYCWGMGGGGVRGYGAVTWGVGLGLVLGFRAPANSTHTRSFRAATTTTTTFPRPVLPGDPRPIVGKDCGYCAIRKCTEIRTVFSALQRRRCGCSGGASSRPPRARAPAGAPDGAAARWERVGAGILGAPALPGTRLRLLLPLRAAHPAHQKLPSCDYYYYHFSPTGAAR